MENIPDYIKELLDKKDIIYEACMGEDSYHKHIRYTYSKSKHFELATAEGMNINDEIPEELYSLSTLYSTSGLKSILNEYNIDLEYLEPLHSQAIAAALYMDYDKPEPLFRQISDEEFEQIGKESQEKVLLSFLALRKEFSEFLLVMLESPEEDDDCDKDYDEGINLTKKGNIEITVRNKVTKKTAKLTNKYLINIAKEFLTEGFKKYKFNRDFYTFDQLYKEKAKFYINSFYEIYKQKYTLKTLPEGYKEFSRFLANNNLERNPAYEEEFNIKNLKKYAKAEIKKGEERKLGRPSKYTTATLRFIVRLSFLIRIEDFIIQFDKYKEEKILSMAEIPIADKQCDFIYNILKTYGLIENVSRSGHSSDGFRLIRSILQEIFKKDENWYKQELERVNEFVFHEIL